MRVSTNPGDILDDRVSAPRGLAVKVIGVDGERLPGVEGAVTQDFVMANGPAFVAPDAKAFLGSLKLLAATTDKAEGAKVVLSAALRGAGAALHRSGPDAGRGRLEAVAGRRKPIPSGGPHPRPGPAGLERGALGAGR
jgi:hypothetical protein